MGTRGVTTMVNQIATLWLMVVVAVSSARDSCNQISPKDALFIVDVQNDFMESVSIDGSPQYTIPADWQSAGGSVVKAGSLQVSSSSEIIDPINAWIDLFTASGGKVFGSLDWHPKDHCSFCRNGTEATNPGYYHSDGAMCTPLPEAGFNDTGRCIDKLALADYDAGTLTQWPDHCVQSEFGSRFSPYLKIPSSAVIVKKGYQDEYDAYSAFGGTLSAQSSPFDTADTETDLIHNADLKTLIEQYEIDRFWVVGLATDFCVGGTSLDALGKNTVTGREAPTTLEHVILLTSCIRAVFPDTSGAAKIAEVGAAGGVLVGATAPADAVQEFCTATATSSKSTAGEKAGIALGSIFGIMGFAVIFGLLGQCLRFNDLTWSMVLLGDR